MARVKCKKCGAECCTCWGCQPSTYVDGLCPKCQTEVKNANDTTNGVQNVRQPS